MTGAHTYRTNRERHSLLRGEYMTNTSEFDYKKYLQLIGKHKYQFVIVALVIMTVVVISSFFLPKRYEAKCTVFIEKSVISDLVKGIAVSPSFEDKIKVLAYAIKSRSLLLKVFNDLDLNAGKQSDAQLENMIKEFQDRTDIKLKDKEGLFMISFVDKDPRLARDYVNALVRRYIEENLSSKRQDSYDATKFLGEQISTVKQKFEEAEAKLNSFKREKSALLGQSEEMVVREIGDAQQRIDDVTIKRRQLESLLNLTKKNDPLKARLSALQKKQEEMRLVYTDNYPEIMALNSEIAAIREQMQAGRSNVDLSTFPSLEQEKITMELNSLREVEMNQRRIIASKQILLRSIPAVRTSYDELERERNTQKNLYEQLMGRYGQSEVSKQMEVQDKSTTFRIVDPAVMPVKPINSPRLVRILVGILGGLVCSFGLLVLRDYLDRSVRSVESLKALGVEVLAVVPKIEDTLALQTVRKKDYWFYGLSGTYFMLILATIPLMFMGDVSINLFNYAGIKENLVRLSNLRF